MDSENDMHDVNDAEPIDDDCYYSSDSAAEFSAADDDGDGGDDEDYELKNDDCYYSSDSAAEFSAADDDGDGGDDEDYELKIDSDDVHASRSQQTNYIALQGSDIRQRQEDDITRVSTVLSISGVAASILLCQYHWSVTAVNEAWFADEEGVRTAAGLLERPVIQFQNAKELTCGICFESTPVDRISSAACGHPFCNLCWRAYISISINGGPGCLMLRCPDPSCGAAIGQDMINLLVSDEDKEKYACYLLRSYIEDNRKTKWCPAPGCEFAVEFVVGSENYDVSCLCSYGFCWNCTEEAHRPVDCGTVAKWVMKNSSESENAEWILANAKPCPQCKKPIEKNQGCMHMTCRPPCKFEFCWLCLGEWTQHSLYGPCNRYDVALEKGECDEVERRREMAKKNIEKYTHYYERWAGNHSSRQKAQADLHRMETVHLKKLSDKQSQPETQLKFITEAWLQIVECRRVLKWTYAYGYYLPEAEHAKRQLFEYLQGDAEAALERLHQCAEEDLQAYLGPEPPPTDFVDFRTKLTGLTSITRNFFENLVIALENGLSEVDSQGDSSKTATSKSGAAKCHRKNL